MPFLRSFCLCAALAVASVGCVANNESAGHDLTRATDATASAAAAANVAAAVAPVFVACAGQVTSAAASSTDVNPPTWTWSRCDKASPQYRISLDDPNAAPTQTGATSFTPSSELYVGNHTLYVSQQRSDGNWSDVAALTIALLPRAQRGMVSQSDPNADASVVYAYPTLSGKTVAAGALEVADANGFTPDDILQGQLGDCYFAATLAAITETRPTYLNTLVAPVVDGYGEPMVDDQNYPLYKITMYYPDAAGVMTTWTMVTDAKLPTIDGAVAYAHPSRDGNAVKIGVPLLEKGFAALDQSQNFLNVVSQDGYGSTLGYVPVGNGGWAWYAFIALAGTSGNTVAMSAVSQTTLMTLAHTPNTAAAVDVNNGWVNPPSALPSGATLAFDGDVYTYYPTGGGASFIIPNQHYYSLVSVAADGTTTLRNPWGGANNGQFSLPFADLGAIFNRFTSVTLP